MCLLWTCCLSVKTVPAVSARLNRITGKTNRRDWNQKVFLFPSAAAIYRKLHIITDLKQNNNINGSSPSQQTVYYYIIFIIWTQSDFMGTFYGLLLIYSLLFLLQLFWNEFTAAGKLYLCGLSGNIQLSVWVNYLHE